MIAAFVRTALTRSPLTFFSIKLAAAGIATGAEILVVLQNGVAAGLFAADAEGAFTLAEDAAAVPGDLPSWYTRLARRARGEGRPNRRRDVRRAWLTDLASHIREARRTDDGASPSAVHIRRGQVAA